MSDWLIDYDDRHHYDEPDEDAACDEWRQELVDAGLWPGKECHDEA